MGTKKIKDKSAEWDKATFSFEKIISRHLTAEERGQIYLNVGLAYLQINNIINKKYDKILDAVLENLREIDGRKKTPQQI